jgi:hypothetical protein
MTGRSAVLLLALLLSGRAAPTADTPDFLRGDTTAVLTLEAPFKELFERGQEDENYTVGGTVTYKDDDGKEMVFRDVRISVRGHTSRRESECTFPKLKLKFPDKASLKIGTHCGDSPGEGLSTKYGRLANELSPRREGLVYRLLSAAAAPTLRARTARITYVDGGAATLVRSALLLEDDDDAIKRMGGRSEITMDAFGDVRARGAGADAARIAFAEALIGNFDWCMRFAPDDIYRCNQPKPLWNVLAFERDGGTGLAIKDFDLAGVVVGGHPWFKNILTEAFVASKSKVDTEVIAQVQRTRTLFSRAVLDAERRHFIDRKPAIYAAIDKADVDTHGRQIARDYANAFYTAIGEDAAYYRPVVTKGEVQVYADANRAAPACGPKDVVRVGTPVNVLGTSGPMSQVTLLDIMWRWGEADPCPAILRGPVWIASDAISADYPPK